MNDSTRDGNRSLSLQQLQAFLQDVILFHGTHRRVLAGSSEAQIDGLQLQIRRRIPVCLRIVLGAVGVLTNPFGFLGRERDWRNPYPWLEREELPTALPLDLTAEAVVGFSDDGSDNYLLLACDDDDGAEVLRFDHAANRVDCTRESFLAHLRREWRSRQRRLKSKTPRKWSVQFGVEPSQGEDLSGSIDRLATAMGAELERKDDGSLRWSMKQLVVEGVSFPLPLQGTSKLNMRWQDGEYTWERHGVGGVAASVTVSDEELRGEPTPRLSGRIERFRRCAETLGISLSECDYGLA